MDVIKICGIGMLILLFCCFVKLVGLFVLYEFLECGFNVFKVIGDV